MSVTVIVINNTLSDYLLNDFGVTIPALGQIVLSDTEPFGSIIDSDDLNTSVINEEVIINDGITNLTTEEALQFLNDTTDYTLYNVTDSISGGTDSKKWAVAMALTLGG